MLLSRITGGHKGPLGLVYPRKSAHKRLSTPQMGFSCAEPDPRASDKWIYRGPTPPPWHTQTRLSQRTVAFASRTWRVKASGMCVGVCTWDELRTARSDTACTVPVHLHHQRRWAWPS
jgi:hypothetical protein